MPSQPVCPICRGATLKPEEGKPGFSACEKCGSVVAFNCEREVNMPSALATFCMTAGKVILITAGVIFLVLGIAFAGCLLTYRS